jgi:hypothetical protein
MVCAVLGLNTLSCVGPGLEIGASSVVWAQLSGFYLKTGDIIQSTKRCVLNKNRGIDNVQKQNSHTKLFFVDFSKVKNLSAVVFFFA